MHDAQVHTAAVDCTGTSHVVVPYTLTRMLCAWPWKFWVQSLHRDRVGASLAGLGAALSSFTPSKINIHFILEVREDCTVILSLYHSTLVISVLERGRVVDHYTSSGRVRADPLPV